VGDDGAARAKVFAVLNAHYHEQEAAIIAQAGVPGAVTIATNMAGRGTDIALGGTGRDAARLREKALAAGGLFVLGTERHESRRVDNQLRGRSGRQGDPGRSKFFLSLEDDLMRIFGPAKLDRLLQKLGLEEDEAIVHPWISKALAKAQQKVEARNFDIRKTILKFDNVMNDQRKVVFEQRIEVMRDAAISEVVAAMQHGLVEDLVTQHLPHAADRATWNWVMLDLEVRGVLTLDVPILSWMKDDSIMPAQVRDHIVRMADAWMAAKRTRWGETRVRLVERRIVMALLDDLWLRHVQRLDQLRRAAPLRAHGRRDPLVEFKIEAFHLFELMLHQLRRNVTAVTMRVGFADQVAIETAETIESEAEHDVVVPSDLALVLH
jgi:preprotein translocase subunit SecA